jgi:hypothetical protein
MYTIINKSYLVEVNLGSTIGVGKQIYFPFIPELEGKMIYGIQAFAAGDMVTSPNGQVVVSNAGLTNAMVTFFVGDQQDLYNVLVHDLRSVSNYGAIRQIVDKRINLTKSYIQLNSVASLSANQSFLFNFIYK